MATLDGLTKAGISASVKPLAHALNSVRQIQEHVSKNVEGCINPIGVEPTKDQIRTYFFSLMGEVYELAQELDWKPWKEKKQNLDIDKIVDEFADILAFLGVIMHYLDYYNIDGFDLADAYVSKTLVNVARFAGEVEGYRVKSNE